MTRINKYSRVLSMGLVATLLILSSCKPQMNPGIEDLLQKIGDIYRYTSMTNDEEKQAHYIEQLGKTASWSQLTYIQDNDSVPMARLAAFMCIMHKNPLCEGYCHT